MRPLVTVQVPPEPPDTERRPVGPSTGRRSCHSDCVRSGDAWKGQTAAVTPPWPLSSAHRPMGPLQDRTLLVLQNRLLSGLQATSDACSAGLGGVVDGGQMLLTSRSWGSPRTWSCSPANDRGRSQTAGCFPPEPCWEQEHLWQWREGRRPPEDPADSLPFTAVLQGGGQCWTVSPGGAEVRKTLPRRGAHLWRGRLEMEAAQAWLLFAHGYDWDLFWGRGAGLQDYCMYNVCINV